MMHAIRCHYSYCYFNVFVCLFVCLFVCTIQHSMLLSLHHDDATLATGLGRCLKRYLLRTMPTM